ncbi:MAG TPA: hypothetical protein P5027_06110 [Flavobacteriales bacterium]|nr:hypothetical protein [Flavobacteriales bacterium]HRW89507.1 hypothetical protein [Flavobacteriales bacterium]
MNTPRLFRSAGLLLMAALLMAAPACKSGKSTTAGTKVKQPFTGGKYESDNRWFRGTGQGASVKQNIARSKADLDAKNQLAGQVGTNMRAVTDQYLGETGNANAADVADKFQTLVREVMSTELADLRKIGEEFYLNEETGQYTAYVAYEIKKNAMFRFMKKQARTSDKIDDLTRQKIEEILDEEIRKTEEEGE